ncbi:DUF3726 domain-containing protein [Paracoccus sp. (in: a-proteobacteria)]|uniref:DUF3726 domain-containing protein n=1 Tax=Paracoccus sp. TaxID=267 RepID=UPI00321FD8E6
MTMHDAMRDVASAGTTRLPATVQLSRNETEALCFKAACGQGMSWGLAEEAGFAAAWLAAQGVDGAGLLLRLLEAGDEAGDEPAAGEAPLCPIRLGVALLDHAGAKALTFAGTVSWPALLVPFLVEATRRLDSAVTLSCDGIALMIAGGRADPAALARLAAVATAAVALQAAQPDASLPAPVQRRAAVATASIEALAAYALRTTVPATEASRSGAGAMGDDND